MLTGIFLKILGDAMMIRHAIHAVNGAVVLLTVGMLSACGGGAATAEEMQQQRALCAAGNEASCRVLGPSGSTTAVPSNSASTAASAVAPGITLKPKELTLSDCTSNIPFVFYGGTPPYTIFTTDNFNVPVSSAQPLGSEYFFLASVGPLILKVPEMAQDGKLTYKLSTNYPGTTLTVVDSKQQVATTKLSFPIIHLDCPANPLLVVSPTSANAHVTEVLAFQVAGGSGTFLAESLDNSIATVIGPSSGTVQGTFAGTFTVQAKAVGSTLIKVSSKTTMEDGQIASQQANIVFTVLPLQ
jgi:hypothetical protein